MTLASATNRVDYVGNGAVDTYSYTFRIISNTDILVTVRDTVGVETTLTLTTHYTVSGVGDAGGGSVALVNGAFDWLDGDGDLKSGYALTIRRVRPLTQLTDIRNQGEFFPETHEDEFDILTMVDQQQQDEIDRSVKLPETVAGSGFTTTLPASIADNPGFAIVVNATGDGFDLADVGGLAVPLTIANGGTNSTAALNNNRVMKSSGGAIVEAAAITASRALISDANGIPTHSAATATEVGYLSGVTSAIQTQIDGTVKTTGIQSIAGAKTFTDPITQDDTSNQIVLGATRTVTINAPTPASASRTWTIPDISADGTFAALEGTQTFSGAKTFSAAVTISPTTNQLVLGATRTVTITAPTPASASRTWTIPDIGADGTFVALQTAQTMTGALTITGTTGAGFRTDSSLEIARAYSGGNGPLMSLFATNNPGSTAEETAIAWGGYDATGAAPRKLASISARWADATAATGYACLRLNATSAGGTQDNTDVQIFGDNGIALFAAPNGTGPGQKIVSAVGGKFHGLADLSFTGTGGILGTTTNDAVDAGKVGEQKIATVVRSAATSVTTATNLDLVSLSLTAGDWNLWFHVGFKMGGATSLTLWMAAISTTSVTLPSGDTYSVPDSSGQFTAIQQHPGLVPGSGNDITLSAPPVRVSLASTTTYYLVVRAAFTVSTLTAYGSLIARRVR